MRFSAQKCAVNHNVFLSHLSCPCSFALDNNLVNSYNHQHCTCCCFVLFLNGAAFLELGDPPIMIQTNFSLSFSSLNYLLLKTFVAGSFFFFFLLWLFVVGWFVSSLLLFASSAMTDLSGFCFLFEWLNLSSGGRMGCSWLHHLTLALDQLRHAFASVFASLQLLLEPPAAPSNVRWLCCPRFC